MPSDGKNFIEHHQFYLTKMKSKGKELRIICSINIFTSAFKHQPSLTEFS